MVLYAKYICRPQLRQSPGSAPVNHLHTEYLFGWHKKLVYGLFFRMARYDGIYCVATQKYKTSCSDKLAEPKCQFHFQPPYNLPFPSGSKPVSQTHLDFHVQWKRPLGGFHLAVATAGHYITMLFADWSIPTSHDLLPPVS